MLNICASDPINNQTTISWINQLDNDGILRELDTQVRECRTNCLAAVFELKDALKPLLPPSNKSRRSGFNLSSLTNPELPRTASSERSIQTQRPSRLAQVWRRFTGRGTNTHKKYRRKQKQKHMRRRMPRTRRK